MIVVRNVFQLKFGKAREAVAHWKRGKALLQKTGHSPIRLLTDVTGPHYTLVMESQFRSLADVEKAHLTTAATREWRAWYKKFTTLVESGRREIYRTVD
jgi:hypothetical protein